MLRDDVGHFRIETDPMVSVDTGYRRAYITLSLELHGDLTHGPKYHEMMDVLDKSGYALFIMNIQ